MGLRIQNNVEAFNTHRQLDRHVHAGGASRWRSSPAATASTAPPTTPPASPSPRRCAARSAASPRRSATRRTASRSSRRRKARSTRCTRCCSASVTSRSSTTTARCRTDDKGAIAAEVTQLASEIKRHRRPTTAVQRHRSCSPARARVTFQVGANDGETDHRLSGDLSRRHRRPQRAHRHHDGLAASRRWYRRRAGRGRRSTPRSRTCPTIRAHVRRGAEPSRAPPEQPGDLPGEPDRFRDPHPRRRHGVGDDQVHEAARSCSRPARACSRRPTRRPRASCRCCAKRSETGWDALASRPRSFVPRRRIQVVRGRSRCCIRGTRPHPHRRTRARRACGSHRAVPPDARFAEGHRA